MRKQNTFTIRSYGKNETGSVLYTISINDKIEYKDIGYLAARRIIEQIIRNDDIIQEADDDKAPYHQQIYHEGYFDNDGITF